MIKFIRRRLGVKIALRINLFALIGGGIIAYLYINQTNAYIEKELLSKGQEKSLIGAKMIGTIIEEAIDNGVFPIKDAFDINYQKIGNFVPPKYHTKYDAYLDKAILKLQDEFLKDESILYSAGTDRNGYLPTHNSRYQKIFTGDLERDNAGNRTKRIFEDEVGRKAAHNLTPGFLQIYQRDTGEVLWDISSPIYVKGKHWGSFRIGMTTEKSAKETKALFFRLHTIMASVFLPFFILSFFVFHRSLVLIEKSTRIINELSVAQHLRVPIKTNRIDEIGELYLAMEDLRQSMLRILGLKKSPQTKPPEKNGQLQAGGGGLN